MLGCTQLIQPLIDSTEQKTKEFKLNSETVEAIKQLVDKLTQMSALIYPISTPYLLLW